MFFRTEIYDHQTDLRAKFVVSIEVDENYFGAKRQCRFHGKFKRGRGILRIFERNASVTELYLTAG